MSCLGAKRQAYRLEPHDLWCVLAFFALALFSVLWPNTGKLAIGAAALPRGSCRAARRARLSTNRAARAARTARAPARRCGAGTSATKRRASPLHPGKAAAQAMATMSAAAPKPSRDQRSLPSTCPRRI